MPLAAIERDEAVDRVLPLDEIAGALLELAPSTASREHLGAGRAPRGGR
jgi:hypothetical protein